MSESMTTDGIEQPSPDLPLSAPAAPLEADTAQPKPAARSLTTYFGLAFDFFLIGLIVVGIYFRFSWMNWSQGADLHPDEYGLTATLTRLSIPDTLTEYFNTRLSSISPYQKYDEEGFPTVPGTDNRMRWGQWPIIIIRLTAELTNNADYGNLRLMGRRLSALCDVLALFVIYLIGARLYSRRVGLLAAALSALAVMQIQQSHFMTSDNFAVFFVTLTMYCAVRVAQKGEWWWYGLFGVSFGMAVASRVNLAPLAVEIVVAAFIANSGELLHEKTDTRLTAGFGGTMAMLALAGIASLVTFRVLHPMSFRAPSGDTTIFTLTPNPDWTASLAVAQAESSGVGGGPPGEQWTNRPAIIFPLTNMVLWGMGLPLGIAAWGGFLWAIRRVLQKNEWQKHVLPLTWAGGFFLFTATRWVKSMRYFLPIYPFLALFAAWAIVELWRLASDGTMDDRRRTAVVYRLSSVIGGTVVLLGTLAWAWGFTSIYRTDNTRIQASRWIYENVPAPLNVGMDTGSGPHTEPIPFSTTQVFSDYPVPVPFSPRVNGVATQFSVGYARNAFVQQPLTLHIVLAADPGGFQPLAQADLTIQPNPDDSRGGTGSVTLGPAPLVKDTTYYLLLTAPKGGPVQISGSTVANENWDEGLPARLDGRDGFGGLYQGQDMSVRWNDDENKRLMFLTTLSQTDYIILPSQRGIWSVSRLPATYPMTMEYYRALFDGRLGFDLVAAFTSPITIGPLKISDVGGSLAWNGTPTLPRFNDNPLSAEEAFSVYDHAPVWIFQKRADFDINKAMAVLNAVDLSRVIVQGPREATAAPTMLMLPEDRLAEQRAGGTWSEMFNPNALQNRYQWLGVVVWWLTCILLGLAAFPITFVALHGLPDRGYALSRNLSLLIIAWASWFLASFRILPFTQLTLWIVTGAMAVASGLIVWRRFAEFKAWLAENWRYVIVVESLAVLWFAFFLLIRLGNGDLWHPSYGGEKPMDFSYFNAVLKSTSFPPYDPWFAGGYLNYYYFGFVVVGALTKMLGIVPAFAYNLILPMLFSLAGMGAFGVAYNLVAAGRRMAGGALPTPHSLQRIVANPYLAGVFAALLFVVLGNLGQTQTIMKALARAAQDVPAVVPIQFVTDLTRAAVGVWRIYVQHAPVLVGTGEWYWNATRVIPDAGTMPITEFPFFTFLYADLHAHMIVLTLTVIALGWALSTVLAARDGERRWIETAATWIVGGIVFGSIQPSNLSDYQTYWALGCVAIVYGQLRKRQAMDWQFAIDVGWRCVLLIGLSMLLFGPYTHWRGEGYGSVQLWKGDKTPLDAYFTIHGLFLFVIFIFLLTEARRWMQRVKFDEVKDLLGPALFAFIAFLLMVFGMWWIGYDVALVAVPLIAWTGLLMIRPDAEPERRAALGLIGLGLTLTMMVEVVVAKGDIGRMNTVFKFYLQVWTMLSIAGGAAIAWVWAQMPEWKPFNRGVWQFGLMALVTVAALYTVLAASAKIQDRISPSAPRTLDGMLYMEYARYADQGQTIELKYDYDAIRWMQENVKGSPVIVEVNAPEYRWGSRYTINTGLPGVLGWNWHQRQQRVLLPDRLIWERSNDINSFYMSVDEKQAMDFLKEYDVSYVVVGEYERAYFPPPSLSKFEQMADQGLLKVAYQNEGAVIYEVVRP
ncbi:MAG TPA: DUF2298 domain-containing protein [Anaerolineales bacterium]|nr:DUF2298 domain-containing protein [Anaerolineales bacterium]